jgi:hypothetical protein
MRSNKSDSGPPVVVIDTLRRDGILRWVSLDPTGSQLCLPSVVVRWPGSPRSVFRNQN